jgi:ketosteroid isomerase-like protein
MQIRAQWQDAWDDTRSDPEAVVGAGEHVVASVRLTARGRTSGASVDLRIHFHVKVRDGKVVYVYEYENSTEALEAAGLSE